MILGLGLLCSFATLIVSVTHGIFVAYPLLLTLAVFMPIYLHQGYQFNALLEMAIAEVKKTLPVISILLLIGAVTASWMAAGTVPMLVYYGIKWIHPQYFILSVFVLTSLVSMLIGTSFGTVSTIGIALMIMAKGSQVNPHLIAGAVIAGAYFGDRCSPMSSSAHLIASITRTQIHQNLKNMVITAAVPLILSLLVYLVLSEFNPAQLSNSFLLTDIPSYFGLNAIVLLPAIAILLLSLLQVETKLTLMVSLLLAIGLSVGYQGESLVQSLTFIVAGYQLDASTPLAAILTGGGMVSMIKVSIVVIASTALAGLFTGTKTLSAIEKCLANARSRGNLFLGTTAIGLASAAFGCTQTIAILLTQQLVQKSIDKSNWITTNWQLI
jgi:NhaC family Na+:H+ antiporter